MTGVVSNKQYRDLQNNYIGIALQDEDHPSLPLISVAIYCALARRLGLDARCCGFPSHVHAVIYPKNGESLDGPRLQAHGNLSDLMYLDPYRSDTEVPVEHLKTQLLAWGVEAADFPRFLSHTSVRNIVLRTSRNILATFHDFRNNVDDEADDNGHEAIRLYGNPFADMDNAFYSALWANFMLCRSPTQRRVPVEQMQFIPMILERFENVYPMDGTFIERYVCSSSSLVASADQVRLLEAIRVVRASDSMPKQTRRRNNQASRDKVRYEIGQVFRHKRYHYTAVITGWDVECSMNSRWIEQNLVDSLSKGRYQSFYHAL